MDLVERYLDNVRSYLPRDRKDDLVAELRENIRAEVEDREERLGRPLSDEERIAVLRAHGHPVLVAGAYRSDGRRLVLGREVVGPELFPFLRLALLAVGAVTALVLLFGSVSSAFGSGPGFPVFRTAVYVLSLQCAIVVAVFAGMEAWFRRNAATWDPRRLPAKDRRPPSPLSLRLQALVQLGFTVLFLGLWFAFPDPLVVFGPALPGLRVGPAWRPLYLAVTASTLLSLVTPTLTLLRPEWRRFDWLTSLFSTGAFIGIAAVGFWNGRWLVPVDPEPTLRALEAAGRVNAFVTICLALALMLSALTTVVAFVRGAWRELRRTPPSPA